MGRHADVRLLLVLGDACVRPLNVPVRAEFPKLCHKGRGLRVFLKVAECDSEVCSIDFNPTSWVTITKSVY